jgi:O-antigen/teichoic acid export membrane protein
MRPPATRRDLTDPTIAGYPLGGIRAPRTQVDGFPKLRRRPVTGSLDGLSIFVVIDLLRQKLASQLGRDHPVARRSAMLVMASATGQGLLFLGTLVAARFFDPSAFGVLGVFSTFAVFFGMIATGRLEAAIPIPRRDHRARSILVATAMIVPVVATTSWIFMESVGGWLIVWTNAEVLSSMSWAIPTATCVLGFRALALMWATRRSLLGGIAIGRIANGGVMGTMFTTTALLDPRVEWMITAWIAGQTAEMSVIAIAVGLDPAFRERGCGHGRWRRALRRYRRFPAILLWSHLLEQLGSHLPTTLVSGSFGADIAGQFNLIQRIVARPIAIIGSSAATMLTTEASRALRSGEVIRPVITACVRRLGTLAIALFLPIAAIGPWALPTLLGDEWASSGVFLLALLPGVVADFIVLPIFPVLGLVERLWVQLAGSLLRIGFATCAIMGTAELDKSATTMMLAVSTAAILVGAIQFVMCWNGTSTTALRRGRDPRRNRKTLAS